MRSRDVRIRAWARTLGLEKTVVEGVELDEDDAIVVAVRPRRSQRDRCPHCRGAALAMTWVTVAGGGGRSTST